MATLRNRQHLLRRIQRALVKLTTAHDVDYFRVDLSEDGNLFVRLNENLQLTLYDGAGNVIEAVKDGRRWAGWRCRR